MIGLRRIQKLIKRIRQNAPRAARAVIPCRQVRLALRSKKREVQKVFKIINRTSHPRQLPQVKTGSSLI